MTFFLTLNAGGPFHGKDFKSRKYGSMGLCSEEIEALYEEVNQRVEAASSS